MPREADVVVVGGGVLGCSCLYHLAKLGVTNTVLLEAHQLTAGDRHALLLSRCYDKTKSCLTFPSLDFHFLLQSTN